MEMRRRFKPPYGLFGPVPGMIPVLGISPFIATVVVSDESGWCVGPAKL